MHIKRLIIGVDPWIFNPNTNGVEYKSIIPYIKYEKRICDGDEAAKEVLNEWNWQFDYERLKTAYSPSYFKSALAASRKDFSVQVEADSEIGAAAKIMTCGRRIPEETFFHTLEKNESDAAKAIDNGSLYYINNFTELDSGLMQDFEILIKHLQKKSVTIEFFLPAWYPMHYEEIKVNPEYRGVLLSEEYLLDFAKANQITVRGTYDPEVCDLENTDFMDTLHVKAERLLEEFLYINSGGR